MQEKRLKVIEKLLRDHRSKLASLRKEASDARRAITRMEADDSEEGGRSRRQAVDALIQERVRLHNNNNGYTTLKCISLEIGAVCAPRLRGQIGARCA